MNQDGAGSAPGAAAPESGEVVLAGAHLGRRFERAEILRDVSLELRAAESVALLGPSGCGKTTLLQILGGLDRPDSGTVTIAGRDLWRLSTRARARVRARAIGFIFQRHNLLEHTSTRDNVALPAWHAGMTRKHALRAADDLLARFGLTERAGARAAVLSPGEAQRVAIARALINRPAVVLADEPTGSLDSSASAVVVAALAEVCEQGAALLVVTHDRDLARGFDRRLHMMDGRLTGDAMNP